MPDFLGGTWGTIGNANEILRDKLTDIKTPFCHGTMTLRAV